MKRRRDSRELPYTCGRCNNCIHPPNGPTCESPDPAVSFWLETCELDPNRDLCGRDGEPALHQAVQENRLDWVKFLVTQCRMCVDQVNESGSTPLFEAVKLGYLSIVRLLVIVGGADVHWALADADTTPLWVAVQGDRLDIVRYLVEECQVAVNRASTTTGAIPVHVATTEGRLEMVRYLVDQGANVEAKTVKGHSPLSIAVVAGSQELVQYFVEVCRVDSDQVLIHDGTAVYLAAKYGHLAIVRYLVENCKADIGRKNGIGSTACFTAAFGGHLEVLRYLVRECQADVRAVLDRYGINPLYCACQNDHPAVVQFLVEEGRLDVNQSAAEDGSTPLMMACQNGNQHLAEYLVNAGASVNQLRPTDNCTSLMIAIDYNHVPLASFLIERGHADVNQVTDTGITALYLAAQHGHLHLLKDLEAKGGRPDIRPGNDTPLVAAVENGHLDVVRHLVNGQADVNQSTRYTTPLVAAAETGVLAVVECLVSAGADVRQPQADGATPLFMAAAEGHENVVRYFLDQTDADANEGVDNHTPWSAAYQSSHFYVMETLLRDPRATNYPRPRLGTPLAELIRGGPGNGCNDAKRLKFLELLITKLDGRCSAEALASRCNGSTGWLKPLLISFVGKKQVAGFRKGFPQCIPRDVGDVICDYAQCQDWTEATPYLLLPEPIREPTVP